MATFTAKLQGDRELVAKFEDLGGQITRWGYSQAFRPAAYSFLPVISNLIHHESGRLGATGRNLRVRAIKKSRSMVGITAMSQFGTTDPHNDPYYGAFVNWGHEIVVHGVHTGRRTTPQEFELKAFTSNLSRAISLATYGLRSVVNAIWNGQASPGSDS